MKGTNWNPFEILGISQPAIAKNGFNTPEVKQAYRKLARKYHPDMVRKLPENEQPGAKEVFQQIVRAYETLTKDDKFNNWVEYGDPEGSLMSQSFDVALPSWMMEEKNQIYILVFIFVLFVIIPIIAISSTKDQEKFHQNGIDRRSEEIMMSVLFDFIDRN